jgi:hypothetical protein
MNLYVWCLVIFVAFLVVPLTVGWWLGRGQPAQVPLARLADPEPLPWEALRALVDDLHWCKECGHRHYGLGPLNCRPYGPFPADTAPLLLLSESAAALVALEREITQMIADAERKTRWLR